MAIRELGEKRGFRQTLEVIGGSVYTVGYSLLEKDSDRHCKR